MKTNRGDRSQAAQGQNLLSAAVFLRPSQAFKSLTTQRRPTPAACSAQLLSLPSALSFVSTRVLGRSRRLRVQPPLPFSPSTLSLIQV